MRLFQGALDTCLDSPLLCQPLSSRFALNGLRALDYTTPGPRKGERIQKKYAHGPKMTLFELIFFVVFSGPGVGDFVLCSSSRAFGDFELYTRTAESDPKSDEKSDFLTLKVTQK